jgi:hypothetical protein
MASFLVRTLGLGFIVLAFGAVSLAAAPLFTFSIALGGEGLINATEYQLSTEAPKKFVLRVKQVFVNDTDLPPAYTVGQKFDSATVDILNNSAAIVLTYSLTDLKIESVNYTSNASNNQLFQEIVLSAKSMLVTFNGS